MFWPSYNVIFFSIAGRKSICIYFDCKIHGENENWFSNDNLLESMNQIFLTRTLGSLEYFVWFNARSIMFGEMCLKKFVRILLYLHSFRIDLRTFYGKKLIFGHLVANFMPSMAPFQDISLEKSCQPILISHKFQRQILRSS